MFIHCTYIKYTLHYIFDDSTKVTDTICCIHADMHCYYYMIIFDIISAIQQYQVRHRVGQSGQSCYTRRCRTNAVIFCSFCKYK